MFPGLGRSEVVTIYPVYIYIYLLKCYDFINHKVIASTELLKALSDNSNRNVVTLNHQVSSYVYQHHQDLQGGFPTFLAHI